MLKLIGFLWPWVTLYDKQREIVESVETNDETVVVAGNMLGKDFSAGLIALAFFLTRHPCRVLTTSVDGAQLEGVLWGEIRRFIQTAAYPLNAEKGGPLLVNHLHLRHAKCFCPELLRQKDQEAGEVCGLSYVMGRVAAKGEGMLGHHIANIGDGVPRTLFIADEASGVDDLSYKRSCTWANRKLIIGNPFSCENFFRESVEGGDVVAAA